MAIFHLNINHIRDITNHIMSVSNIICDILIYIKLANAIKFKVPAEVCDGGNQMPALSLEELTLVAGCFFLTLGEFLSTLA